MPGNTNIILFESEFEIFFGLLLLSSPDARALCVEFAQADAILRVEFVLLEQLVQPFGVLAGVHAFGVLAIFGQQQRSYAVVLLSAEALLQALILRILLQLGVRNVLVKASLVHLGPFVFSQQDNNNNNNKKCKPERNEQREKEKNTRLTFEIEVAFLCLVLDLLLQTIVLELVLIGHVVHAVHLFHVNLFSQRKQAKAVFVAVVVVVVVT